MIGFDGHDGGVAKSKPEIEHVVLVGSGKGGVGKSSVVLELALSLLDKGCSVGVLDADLTAPDIPLMFGLTRQTPAEAIDLWRAPGHQKTIAPLNLRGLQVMSVQFLMSEEQALAIGGHMQRMLLSRLWTGVSWGKLDYLLVDLPPGTGEIQQSVIDVMPVAGTLVVVTAQDVAHLDARKLLTFLEQREVPVLGGVENMTEVTCPHCDDSFELFPPVSHERSIWASGVTRLASLPFDRAALAHGPDHSSAFAGEIGKVTAAVMEELPPSSAEPGH